MKKLKEEFFKLLPPTIYFQIGMTFMAGGLQGPPAFLFNRLVRSPPNAKSHEKTQGRILQATPTDDLLSDRNDLHGGRLARAARLFIQSLGPFSSERKVT